MTTNPAAQAIQLLLVVFSFVMGISACFTTHTITSIIAAVILLILAFFIPKIMEPKLVKSDALDDEGTYTKPIDAWEFIHKVQLVAIATLFLLVFVLPYFL